MCKQIDDGEPTACMASPEVMDSILAEVAASRSLQPADARIAKKLGLVAAPGTVERRGFNDGLIYEPTDKPPLLALAAARGPGASRAPSLAPVSGKLHALVLCVDFSDNPGKATQAHYESLLFDAKNPNSMTSFYKDLSYGKLTVSGVVTPWLRAPKTYSYYTNGASGTGTYPKNTQKLVEDALDLYVKQGGNLASFDKNGDGYIDGLFLVHAGTGAETVSDPVLRKNMIWSHKWTLPKAYVNNGVKAFAYFTAPEDGKLGVFSHEFGHFLGLPDLYDTTYKSNGIGNWCLMAGGSWNGGGDIPARMSAWCLAKLGWIAPTNVTKAGTATLAALEKDQKACRRLWKKGAAGQEYFLIENRQQKGRDKALPGHGLAVWHINERQTGNTNPNDYLVGLVQADGRRDLELNANRGDDGDTFPGSAKVAAVTDASAAQPNTRSATGAKTGVSITGIKETGGKITAKLAV